MKNIIFIATLILGTSILYSQDCDCLSTFHWMQKTFEENDAGFQYILNSKGQKAYTFHNQDYLLKIENTKDVYECQDLLNEWLLFFREGHIGMEYIGKPISNSQSKNFDDWESILIKNKDFKQYLDQKQNLDYEGIWQSDTYEIGIKKVDTAYIGTILKSKNKNWKKNQVKLKIFENRGEISSIYYMGNHSKVESEYVELYGKNILKLGDIVLNRVYPIIEDNFQYNLHFKALESEKPFVEKINQNTLYLRIPSFEGSAKKAIDNVINEYKTKILNTQNLIIDIRNGTGGSDISYSEILPFLYTNPIRTSAVYYKSTVLNNQRHLDFINNTGIAKLFGVKLTDAEKEEFQKEYEKLLKNLGEFVNLDTTEIDITTYDTIYPFPQNIGIIHNQNNGSTDEQFLLTAKQSKKVKLFGRPTQGALDASNMYFVVSPCNDFRLWYALTISGRVPNMAIDNIGIQPDYYIDEQIPEYKWIEYVSKILNEYKVY